MSRIIETFNITGNYISRGQIHAEIKGEGARCEDGKIIGTALYGGKERRFLGMRTLRDKRHYLSYVLLNCEKPVEKTDIRIGLIHSVLCKEPDSPVFHGLHNYETVPVTSRLRDLFYAVDCNKSCLEILSQLTMNDIEIILRGKKSLWDESNTGLEKAACRTGSTCYIEISKKN